MADTPVTHIYREQITRRFESEEEDARRFDDGSRAGFSGFLTPDAMVAGRYRVLAGPLGGVSGEAEVYRCRDEHSEEELAVKLYRHDATPKEAVIQRLEGLAHPYILRLLAHGHWQGRFFEVSELCAGGVMADAMPFDEKTLVALLPMILEGLAFCHGQGIVHRDLKPNNLFFRDAGRSQVLIGDFGISSYLERDEEAVRETHTAANLTLDYAAPELLDGHEVGPKTDYYALGITLLHLLRGRSPFHGLSPNDVLVAHLRGRVEHSQGVSEHFAGLLGGLTLGNPDKRWGFDQVAAWLRGDSPEQEPGAAAWSTVARDGHPYPGYPQARTPRELANSLTQFDAFRQLQRGDIRRWLFDHFDQRLADQVEVLEQDVEAHPEQLLGRLRFILDPQAPLELGETRLGSLKELVELLEGQQESTLKNSLGVLYRGGVLEAWIHAGRLAGERSDELLERLQALRLRLPDERHQAVALDALLYTLVPDTPLALARGALARSPLEIARIFEQDPEVQGPALARHLFDKRLDEWLRAAGFSGWQQHLDFLQELRLWYLEQPLLGVRCLCWRFNPGMPLLFNKVKVTRPEQLAQLIDLNPENTTKGMKLMEQGILRAWLVGSERIADVLEFDHALLALDVTPGSRLETILQLLNPRLSRPKLEVSPATLNFGSMLVGDTRAQILRIENSGRGCLTGEIKLAEYGAGLMLDTYMIEGNKVEVQVRVISLGLAPARYRNTLSVQTNGGEQEIPVWFAVRRPVDKRNWWQKMIDRFYS
jgi:hypothetical protein